MKGLIMKKTFIAIALSLASVTMVGGTASAFGLGSIFGGGKTAKTQSKVTPEIIVKKYAIGTKSVLAGHENMLSALDFRDEAAKVKMSLKKITGDPNTAADDDTQTVITESAKLIDEKLNGEELSLSGKAKQEVTKAMLNLGKGLIAYKGMASDVKAYQPDATSIGGAAGAAITIVKAVPGDTNNLYSLLSNLVKYAKGHGITVPKDATKALAGGAW